MASNIISWRWLEQTEQRVYINSVWRQGLHNQLPENPSWQISQPITDLESDLLSPTGIDADCWLIEQYWSLLTIVTRPPNIPNEIFWSEQIITPVDFNLTNNDHDWAYQLSLGLKSWLSTLYSEELEVITIGPVLAVWLNTDKQPSNLNLPATVLDLGWGETSLVWQPFSHGRVGALTKTSSWTVTTYGQTSELTGRLILNNQEIEWVINVPAATTASQDNLAAQVIADLLNTELDNWRVRTGAYCQVQDNTLQLHIDALWWPVITGYVPWLTPTYWTIRTSPSRNTGTIFEAGPLGFHPPIMYWSDQLETTTDWLTNNSELTSQTVVNLANIGLSLTNEDWEHPYRWLDEWYRRLWLDIDNPVATRLTWWGLKLTPQVWGERWRWRISSEVNRGNWLLNPDTVFNLLTSEWVFGAEREQEDSSWLIGEQDLTQNQYLPRWINYDLIPPREGRNVILNLELTAILAQQAQLVIRNEQDRTILILTDYGPEQNYNINDSNSVWLWHQTMTEQPWLISLTDITAPGSLKTRTFSYELDRNWLLNLIGNSYELLNLNTKWQVGWLINNRFQKLKYFWQDPWWGWLTSRSQARIQVTVQNPRAVIQTGTLTGSSPTAYRENISLVTTSASNRISAWVHHINNYHHNINGLGRFTYNNYQLQQIGSRVYYYVDDIVYFRLNEQRQHLNFENYNLILNNSWLLEPNYWQFSVTITEEFSVQNLESQAENWLPEQRLAPDRAGKRYNIPANEFRLVNFSWRRCVSDDNQSWFAIGPDQVTIPAKIYDLEEVACSIQPPTPIDFNCHYWRAEVITDDITSLECTQLAYQDLTWWWGQPGYESVGSSSLTTAFPGPELNNVIQAWLTTINRYFNYYQLQTRDDNTAVWQWIVSPTWWYSQYGQPILGYNSNSLQGPASQNFCNWQPAWRSLNDHSGGTVINTCQKTINICEPNYSYLKTGEGEIHSYVTHFQVLKASNANWELQLGNLIYPTQWLISDNRPSTIARQLAEIIASRWSDIRTGINKDQIKIEAIGSKVWLWITPNQYQLLDTDYEILITPNQQALTLDRDNLIFQPWLEPNGGGGWYWTRQQFIARSDIQGEFWGYQDPEGTWITLTVANELETTSQIAEHWQTILADLGWQEPWIYITTRTNEVRLYVDQLMWPDFQCQLPNWWSRPTMVATWGGIAVHDERLQWTSTGWLWSEEFQFQVLGQGCFEIIITWPSLENNPWLEEWRSTSLDPKSTITIEQQLVRQFQSWPGGWRHYGTWSLTEGKLQLGWWADMWPVEIAQVVSWWQPTITIAQADENITAVTVNDYPLWRNNLASGQYQLNFIQPDYLASAQPTPVKWPVQINIGGPEELIHTWSLDLSTGEVILTQATLEELVTNNLTINLVGWQWVVIEVRDEYMLAEWWSPPSWWASNNLNPVLYRPKLSSAQAITSNLSSLATGELIQPAWFIGGQWGGEYDWSVSIIQLPHIVNWPGGWFKIYGWTSDITWWLPASSDFWTQWLEVAYEWLFQEAPEWLGHCRWWVVGDQLGWWLDGGYWQQLTQRPLKQEDFYWQLYTLQTEQPVYEARFTFTGPDYNTHYELPFQPSNSQLNVVYEYEINLPQVRYTLPSQDNWPQNQSSLVWWLRQKQQLQPSEQYFDFQSNGNHEWRWYINRSSWFRDWGQELVFSDLLNNGHGPYLMQVGEFNTGTPVIEQVINPTSEVLDLNWWAAYPSYLTQISGWSCQAQWWVARVKLINNNPGAVTNDLDVLSWWPGLPGLKIINIEPWQAAQELADHINRTSTLLWGDNLQAQAVGSWLEIWTHAEAIQQVLGLSACCEDIPAINWNWLGDWQMTPTATPWLPDPNPVPRWRRSYFRLQLMSLANNSTGQAELPGLGIISWDANTTPTQSLASLLRNWLQVERIIDHGQVYYYSDWDGIQLELDTRIDRIGPYFISEDGRWTWCLQPADAPLTWQPSGQEIKPRCGQLSFRADIGTLRPSPIVNVDNGVILVDSWWPVFLPNSQWYLKLNHIFPGWQLARTLNLALRDLGWSNWIQALWTSDGLYWWLDGQYSYHRQGLALPLGQWRLASPVGEWGNNNESHSLAIINVMPRAGVSWWWYRGWSGSTNPEYTRLRIINGVTWAGQELPTLIVDNLPTLGPKGEIAAEWVRLINLAVVADPIWSSVGYRWQLLGRYGLVAIWLTSGWSWLQEPELQILNAKGELVILWQAYNNQDWNLVTRDNLLSGQIANTNLPPITRLAWRFRAGSVVALTNYNIDLSIQNINTGEIINYNWQGQFDSDIEVSRQNLARAINRSWHSASAGRIWVDVVGEWFIFYLDGTAVDLLGGDSSELSWFWYSDRWQITDAINDRVTNQIAHANYTGQPSYTELSWRWYTANTPGGLITLTLDLWQPGLVGGQEFIVQAVVQDDLITTLQALAQSINLELARRGRWGWSWAQVVGDRIRWYLDWGIWWRYLNQVNPPRLRLTTPAKLRVAGNSRIRPDAQWRCFNSPGVQDINNLCEPSLGVITTNEIECVTELTWTVSDLSQERDFDRCQLASCEVLNQFKHAIDQQIINDFQAVNWFWWPGNCLQVENNDCYLELQSLTEQPLTISWQYNSLANKANWWGDIRIEYHRSQDWQPSQNLYGLVNNSTRYVTLSPGEVTQYQIQPRLDWGIRQLDWVNWLTEFSSGRAVLTLSWYSDGSRSASLGFEWSLNYQPTLYEISFQWWQNWQQQTSLPNGLYSFWDDDGNWWLSSTVSDLNWRLDWQTEQPVTSRQPLSSRSVTHRRYQISDSDYPEQHINHQPHRSGYHRWEWWDLDQKVGRVDWGWEINGEELIIQTQPDWTHRQALQEWLRVWWLTPEQPSPLARRGYHLWLSEPQPSVININQTVIEGRLSSPASPELLASLDWRFINQAKVYHWQGSLFWRRFQGSYHLRLGDIIEVYSTQTNIVDPVEAQNWWNLFWPSLKADNWQWVVEADFHWSWWSEQNTDIWRWYSNQPDHYLLLPAGQTEHRIVAHRLNWLQLENNNSLNYNQGQVINLLHTNYYVNRRDWSVGSDLSDFWVLAGLQPLINETPFDYELHLRSNWLYPLRSGQTNWQARHVENEDFQGQITGQGGWVDYTIPDWSRSLVEQLEIAAPMVRQANQPLSLTWSWLPLTGDFDRFQTHLELVDYRKIRLELDPEVRDDTTDWAWNSIILKPEPNRNQIRLTIPALRLPDYNDDLRTMGWTEGMWLEIKFYPYGTSPLIPFQGWRGQIRVLARNELVLQPLSGYGLPEQEYTLWSWSEDSNRRISYRIELIAMPRILAEIKLNWQIKRPEERLELLAQNLGWEANPSQWANISRFSNGSADWDNYNYKLKQLLLWAPEISQRVGTLSGLELATKLWDWLELEWWTLSREPEGFQEIAHPVNLKLPDWVNLPQLNLTQLKTDREGNLLSLEEVNPDKIDQLLTWLREYVSPVNIKLSGLNTRWHTQSHGQWSAYSSRHYHNWNSLELGGVNWQLKIAPGFKTEQITLMLAVEQVAPQTYYYWHISWYEDNEGESLGVWRGVDSKICEHQHTNFLNINRERYLLFQYRISNDYGLAWTGYIWYEILAQGNEVKLVNISQC